MKITFFPQGCIPFHAYTLDERPLGGVETAAIRLAQAMHDLGHEVTVYCSYDMPPPSGPSYVPFSLAQNMPPADVFICLREWFPLISQLPVKKRFLWTGDNEDQIQTFGIGDRRIANILDGLLAVGTWQADNLSMVSGFPREKVYVLRNGIHLPYFEGHEERQRNRLVYTSTPFRGLNYLPAVLKELRKKYTDLELHVFSDYEVYKKPGTGYNAQLEQEHEQFKQQLQTMPGVVLRGNVKQKELAREFKKATVLAYPNIYKETCCISAMEAQAGGCPIVTSDLAGLRETVGDAGILLTEPPGSKEYLTKFIQAVDAVLSNPDLFNKLSTNGLRRAQEFSWEVVAKRFEAYLKQVHGL